MSLRFDLLHRDGRELLLGDAGCSRQGSELMQAVLGRYRMSGRAKYRFFLSSFMNYVMTPGEDPWTFLFEEFGAVQRRVLRWGRDILDMEFEPSEYGDGSFDATRLTGDINHYARGLSVVRRFYLVAQDPRFALRPPKANPISIPNWDEKPIEERILHCIARYGEKNARFMLKRAGSLFNPQNRAPYIPSLEDPAGLGDRIFDAMVAMLGDHPAADLAGVNRDDGQRWADVNHVTFADWAVSRFDRILMGSNKYGPVDDKGRRLPSKQVGISEQVRDRIHRRVDAEHARNPALPSMVQLRSWLAKGNHDELRRWFVFAKPGTNQPYGYWGYHRLEVKATSAAGITVFRMGSDRPATSRWVRRALHEDEYLRIHREERDPERIKLRLARLSFERGHRSDQHENYASHGRWVLAEENKMKRQDRARAAREGKAAKAARTAPQAQTAADQMHATARRRAP